MIVSYTSEQNGVAKRKNKSEVEAAHAILHDQKLPKFLWGESTNVVVYVQNRVPHQALEKKPLKKCSQVSSLMLAISVSLVALYTFM